MSPSPWAKTPARTRAKPISSEMETQSIIWPCWKQVKVTVEKKYGVGSRVCAGAGDSICSVVQTVTIQKDKGSAQKENS